MLLLVDNYDSFTYNLQDYFLQLGVQISVVRNDESEQLLFDPKYQGVVLSPGPGTPKDSGKLMKVLDHYHNKVPILGICLGHQAIGEYFGATLKKGQQPMHGKISKITLESSDQFEGLGSNLEVVRYHSLILKNLPNSLLATSFTEHNEIMSLKHNSLPIWGIQFHPEAWLTQGGLKILQNWLRFNKLVK